MTKNQLEEKDRQYRFRKGRFTGNLLSLITDSWSSSLSRLGETFSVVLDISKAFDRVWHKSLLAKLPSFGFFPSLCSFFFSFLSGRLSQFWKMVTVLPVRLSRVEFHRVLSYYPLSSLFINDLLSVTNYPIHSYADDSTLHFSTSFDRRPTLQDLQDSGLEAAERLTSYLVIISKWGRRNLVSLNASKTQFLHLSTQHNLPLFFDNTQLSHSSTLNILGLSFTQNLNWKLHISSLSLNQLPRSWAFCIVSASFSPPQR